MKIYVGKNKKSAKQVTLKDLMLSAIKMKATEYRLGDDSGSGISISQDVSDGVLDVEIHFDPENDTEIIEVDVWKTKFKLDYDNMEKLNK